MELRRSICSSPCCSSGKCRRTLQRTLRPTAIPDLFRSYPSTGKPIDEKTLRKAFADEIRTGAFEMDMVASSAMAQQIKAGAGWAIMFYMKNRMRWADRDSLELTGKDGGPVDHDIRVEFVRAPKRPA
jgi:hypothetical protein